jgi:hypothetical protein
MVREKCPLGKKAVKSQETVRESPTYCSTMSGKFDSLMVEGRIGNKLASLGLAIPAALLKVDMSRGQVVQGG